MEVLKAIFNRRSVRSYAEKPIAKESYDRLLQALRSAPSACNLQPWRFILVRDESLRKQLAAAANGQSWIADAPLIVVACGFPEKAYRKMAGHYNSLEVDVAIALDHLSLTAVSENLATCWIGAFDENAVKKLLDIPPEVRVIAVMPVGYPASPDLIQPLDENRRKSPQQIFCSEKFS